jgi:caspase domain-containing protein
LSDRPARGALVVGIGDYPVLCEPGLARTVASAVADAREFHRWLTEGRCLDRTCDRRLHPDEVRLHLSPAEAGARPCTADAIARSIVELIKDPPRSELFVYFAGHGFSVRDELVGPPVDYLVLEDFEDLAVSGNQLIDVPYLVRLLSACGPGAQYFFLDACRNEAVQGAIRGGSLGLNVRPSAAGAPDQHRMFSTRSGAQAAGASRFSPLLVRGLRGEGPAKQWHVRADGQDELAVRFASVFQFVRGEMVRAGAQLPVTDRHGGDADVIDVIDPPPRLRCTVSFTPAAAAEGSMVTARIRGAVAGTAKVRGGVAELELLPDHYQIVPSGAERLFRPALRPEPIWDARALAPPFETFVANPDPRARSSELLDLLMSAPPLDREIYATLLRGDGVRRGPLEAMDPGPDRARSIADEIAARPARLGVMVPDRALALTCRVETRSGRAMPAEPRGRGSAIGFALPPDSYRLRLSQYGAVIHDQEIEASPGDDLMVEPARALERDELHRHILDECGREAGCLATPEGPLLDGDLALWLPWWACWTGGFLGAGRVVVAIATRRPFRAPYIVDAGGQDRSVSGALVFKQVDAEGHRVVLLGFDIAQRGLEGGRWLVVPMLTGDSTPERPHRVPVERATGFAISMLPDHATLLVLVDETDGEIGGSLHHLRMPGRDETDDILVAWWRALRVGALAQRALRDRRRVDLAALLTGVDLGELARTSPVAVAALRVLAVRQADSALVARLDELRSPALPAGPEHPVLLDELSDPAQLQLPPGAQLRWDSPLLSFTLAPER